MHTKRSYDSFVRADVLRVHQRQHDERRSTTRQQSSTGQSSESHSPAQNTLSSDLQPPLEPSSASTPSALPPTPQELALQAWPDFVSQMASAPFAELNTQGFVPAVPAPSTSAMDQPAVFNSLFTDFNFWVTDEWSMAPLGGTSMGTSDVPDWLEAFTSGGMQPSVVYVSSIHEAFLIAREHPPRH